MMTVSSAGRSLQICTINDKYKSSGTLLPLLACHDGKTVLTQHQRLHQVSPKHTCLSVYVFMLTYFITYINP
jgi:hypothetical protein